MAKLTKASFAAAKRRLGIKKVTKKNIGRIARAARKGVTRKKSRASRRKTRSTKRKNNPKRRVNRTAKGKSLVQSATQIAKAGAILMPIVVAATSPGDTRHKAVVYMSYVSGVDMGGAKATFKLDRLLMGWGPYIGVSVASKIAGKINGLIRRI